MLWVRCLGFAIWFIGSRIIGFSLRLLPTREQLIIKGHMGAMFAELGEHDSAFNAQENAAHL